MFTNSVVETVDKGTVHLHSDISAFANNFPKTLLDDAFTFAVENGMKQQITTSTQNDDATTTTTTTTTTRNIKIAVQLSDDSLPFAVRLIQELEEREKARRSQQQQQNNHISIITMSFFILADNTFAPCCADQVTAQRNQADAIIHFGQTCFSQSIDSIPCGFFVPPWKLYNNTADNSATSAVAAVVSFEKDILKKIKAFPQQKMENFVFVFAAGVSQLDVETFKDKILSEQQQNIVADKNKFIFVTCGSKRSDVLSAKGDEEWNVDGASFPIAQKTGNQVLFFLSSASSESSSANSNNKDEVPFNNSPLHQLALIEYWNSARRMKREQEQEQDDENDNDNNNEEKIWFSHHQVSTNSNSSRPITSLRAQSNASRDVARRVNQRMRNVEALKHASSVGLLVMSLSISEHRNLLSKLQNLLRSGGKRAYVVFIGHLNEYKLANFADSIDVFVSLACPNSRPAFFASKDDNFNVPLLFPAEVILWYERDVKEIPEETVSEKFLDPELFTTRAGRSLARVVVANNTNNKNENDNDDGNTQQQQQKEGTLIVNAPMHIATTNSQLSTTGTTTGTLARFQERSYQGLDPRYGKDSVQEDIVEGLSGIAKGYETEKKQ